MQDRNVDLQEAKLRSVRRRLFQDDDDQRRDRETGDEDNVANCFFEEIRQHKEEAKKRWNFDFEKEIPLPGRYEWFRLDRERNEIPMTTEVQNETVKPETVNKEVEEVETIEEKEEDPPEEKKTDADDTTEASKQQNLCDVS